MAEYVRGAGRHIAERVRPAPGSDEETRLAELAKDPTTGWRLAEPDKTPRKTAAKGGK